ncbi:putative terminal uridylyltransferase 4 isoform X4 [Apostichopus japonicus]|uniref:Putative terminal uridylyltransferase 4 isoform X4 n=1 Tax=Stichopus japonicus TaxID=307972 RepID=A0A2G8KMH2_STIJA|nr:putative terminal uridylyltransferase 4 isoform X4 [Apostichopus japonicus]
MESSHKPPQEGQRLFLTATAGLPDIGLLEITNEKSRAKTNESKSSRPPDPRKNQSQAKLSGVVVVVVVVIAVVVLVGVAVVVQTQGRMVQCETITDLLEWYEEETVQRIMGMDSRAGVKGQGDTWGQVRTNPIIPIKRGGMENLKETHRLVYPRLRMNPHEITAGKKALQKERKREEKTPAVGASAASVGHEQKDQVKDDRSGVEPDKLTISQEEVDSLLEGKELKRMGIFKLQKRKPKYPKAKYFCRLCNYHMDTLEDCEDHASQTRHKRLMKNKSVADNFKTVPKLSACHAEALTATIEDIVEKVGLTDKMMAERREVASRINVVIRNSMPDCLVQLYGSSVSGFGFKTSGVNLNLTTSGKRSPAEMLVTVLNVLSEEKEFCKDVGSKFEDKYPVVFFTDSKSNLYCELGTGSEQAVATSHLLQEYSKIDERVSKLAIAFRHWAHTLEIDRPQDGSLPPYIYSLMVIYFLQRRRPIVVPVIQEDEKLPPIRNEESLGELWIAIFHCYLVERNLEEEVICIRKRKAPTRKDLNINNRRIVVEDPCAPEKKAVTKYLSAAEVMSYIMDCFHIALEYFSACDQNEDNKSSTQKETEGAAASSRSRGNESLNQDSSRLSISLEEDSLLANYSPEETDGETLSWNLYQMEMNETIEEESLDHLRGTSLVVEGESNNEAGSLLIDFNFSFDSENLSRGQKVPKICSNCQQEGHVSKDCDDDKLPDLVPLPKMEKWYLNAIHHLCNVVCDQFSSKRWEIEERNRIIVELEKYIQYHSSSSIKLDLFGSSVNGFGFQNSDLDICMTFKDNATGEGINVPEVIQTLAQILRKHHSLFSVIPITTAKVPIVKFVHRPTQLEGDISLYNTLAQHNTQLLRTYSEIDKRVCRLGHMVKAFAKECGIADASRGSLSSYAYILMTLYFLQQTSPPVIPVLQELYEGDQKPERIVEGRNTWFFSDIRRLKNVWKGYGMNKLSEEELWLSFLRFYTEQFDWGKYVVCTRHRKPLTRFEKMWMGNSRRFAIEDPFDLDHNLGGALSRKMANYIMLIFRKGRERFGTPQNTPKQISHLYRFFLDYQYLTDGQQPPNDRGCRICGKIGHYVKDCPIKLRGKDRKQQAKASTPQKIPKENTAETPKPLDSKSTTSKKEPAREKMQTEKPTTEQRKPEKPTKEKATTDKPTTQKPSKERPVEVAMEIDESVVKPERKIDHQQKKEVNNGPNAATQNPSKSEKVASESTINNRRKCPEENLRPSGMNTGERSIITTSQTPHLVRAAEPLPIPTRQNIPQQMLAQTPPLQVPTLPRPVGSAGVQMSQSTAPLLTSPVQVMVPPASQAMIPPSQVFNPPRQFPTPPRQVGNSSLQDMISTGQAMASPVKATTPPMQVRSPPRQVGTPTRQMGNPPLQAGTPTRQMGTPPLQAGTPPRPPMTPPSPALLANQSGIYGSPGNYSSSPQHPMHPLPYGMGSPPGLTLSPGHVPQPLMSLPFQYPGNALFPSHPGVNPVRQPVPLVMMPNPMYQGAVPTVPQTTPNDMKSNPFPFAQASAELQQMLGMTPPGQNSHPQALKEWYLNDPNRGGSA